MIDPEILAKLGDLYGKTGMDWELKVRHCLVELTALTAIVTPEGMHTTRYRVDADTLGEAVNGSITRAYKEIILGVRVPPFAFFTNPDDKKLDEWINKGWPK